MITIRRAMNRPGYKISTGDHRPAYALDENEVCEAVKHYYGNHAEHDPEKCPFCKQIAERGTA